MKIKHKMNMKEKYIIRNSSLPDDTDLANDMLGRGYKITMIIPRFFGDGTCSGYTYWFEHIE